MQSKPEEQKPADHQREQKPGEHKDEVAKKVEEDYRKPYEQARHPDGERAAASPTNPVNQPSGRRNPGNLDDTPQQAPNMEAADEARQAKAREDRERNRMPEARIEPLEDNPVYQKALKEQQVGAGQDTRKGEDVTRERERDPRYQPVGSTTLPADRPGHDANRAQAQGQDQTRPHNAQQVPPHNR